MKNKITMQEIADMLGISKVTVSKALNGKDGVGAELKKKILDIAEEYGYEMPSKRKTDEKSIGKKIVVFCDNKFFDEADKSYFYMRIYKQISVELAKNGCIASLLTIRKEKDYDTILPLISGQDFDGVIFLGRLDPVFLNQIGKLPLTRLFVDCPKGEMDGDSIFIEGFYTTYELTRYLVKNGHRDIGFIGSIHVTESIRDRFLGYCRAMMEFDLPIRKEWIVEDRDEQNERIELQLPEQLPGAFVSNCDESSYSFLQLLARNGIRVPEDVSVISFDGDSFSELSHPKLTTLAVDVSGLAKKAAKMILERIQMPDLPKNRIQIVDGKIEHRDSVRKVSEE